MSTFVDTLNQPIDLPRVARQLAVLVGCRPATASRHVRRPRACWPDIEQPQVETYEGCGWFDSSHELHRGLEVVEHRDGALFAEGLPLPVWLHHALQEPAP